MDNRMIANRIRRIAKSLLASKWNRKEYQYYVLLEKEDKIESGWEYLEDAKDRVAELKFDDTRSRVVTKKTLLMMKKNPEDDSNWHVGPIR